MVVGGIKEWVGWLWASVKEKLRWMIVGLACFLWACLTGAMGVAFVGAFLSELGTIKANSMTADIARRREVEPMLVWTRPTLRKFIECLDNRSVNPQGGPVVATGGLSCLCEVVGICDLEKLRDGSNEPETIYDRVYRWVAGRAALALAVITEASGGTFIVKMLVSGIAASVAISLFFSGVSCFWGRSTRTRVGGWFPGERVADACIEAGPMFGIAATVFGIAVYFSGQTDDTATLEAFLAHFSSATSATIIGVLSSILNQVLWAFTLRR